MNNLPQPRLGRGHEPSTADVAILGPVLFVVVVGASMASAIGGCLIILRSVE